jgi:hypothetical protein
MQSKKCGFPQFLAEKNVVSRNKKRYLPPCAITVKQIHLLHQNEPICYLEK